MYICIYKDTINCTQENFGGEKLANLANCELFTKLLFTNIHRYTKNVFYIYICTDLSLFANFLLANSLYLYGSKFYPLKFSRARYFL